MDRDVWLLLVGAGIGLVSAIIGAFVQFGLSLWKDRITRSLEKKEEEQEVLEKIRNVLMGGDPVPYESIIGSIWLPDRESPDAAVFDEPEEPEESDA